MHILLVRSSTDGVSPAASRLVEQAFAPITWIDVTGQFGLSQALEQQAYNAALVYAPLDWIDTAEAVRQITAGGLGKPCVVIAGQGSEELAVRCLKAGASDYLTDQTLERLPEALRNTLQPSVEQQQAAPLDWAAGVWSEALVQALTQAPKTLLALLDRAGTVLAANRALEQQVLPDGSGLVGKPVWALFPGLTTEARQAVLEQVIQGRQSVRLKDHQGNQSLDGMLFPFVSAQPSDVQAVLLARDISEFEHNQAAMSQASEVIRLDLEQRVLERSQQLTRVNQELRNEILLRRLAEQQYLRSTRRAEALANVAARLNTQLDLQPLLETITQQTILALNYPVCCLFLYDEENDRLTVTAMTGLAYADGQKPGFPRALYDSYRLAVGPVVVIADVPKMPGEFEQVMLRSLPLRTMILVSMQSGEELVGALMVASQDDVHLPTHDEVLLLQALAEQATVAISNARLFREVNESHESLRLLSKQLVNAQEAEKRRLARELHDEVGQMLTSLNLNLGAINQGLEAPQPSRRQVHEQIEQTRQMVDHLLQQVRDMSLDLRPSILDDLGLLPAVLALTDRYTAQTGVQVALRHNDLARRCPPEIETAAFRMIQEALTNVARHAQVETVAVRLLSGPLSLVVQVEDNGGGFDPEQVRRLASSGLSGMQERVRLCGGSLQIEAHPGRGACLTAEFPLDPPMETPYWTARDPAAQAGEP